MVKKKKEIKQNQLFIYIFPCTCVIMPDSNFPNFSQVFIRLQVKLVQTTTLKCSIPLQMARATLVHSIQADANMCCGT